jgi:hypothetical protein
MTTLADVMTRDQRHAFMRMQHAAQMLQDPDGTLRERRSALVSFYRGFRALAEAYDRDPALLAASRSLNGFVARQVGK